MRGDEQLAVRALEAAVTLGVACDQLRGKGLLAMRTDDLLRRVLCGGFGHVSKVHPHLALRKKEPVVLDRGAFLRRRRRARDAEMDQAEETLTVRKTERFASRSRA
jgi:hypothetical protein